MIRAMNYIGTRNVVEIEQSSEIPVARPIIYTTISRDSYYRKLEIRPVAILSSSPEAKPLTRGSYSNENGHQMIDIPNIRRLKRNRAKQNFKLFCSYGNNYVCVCVRYCTFIILYVPQLYTYICRKIKDPTKFVRRNVH